MNLTPDDPKLTAYALGELDATERAAVEAALARSPECRCAVEEIRALAGELTTELTQDAAMAKASLTAEPWTRAGDFQSPSAMSSTPDGDCKSPALAAVADAPGAGKVIFLPWRQWRTVGLAAAAAVVMGFIVAKVWQREQPKPFARVEKRELMPLNRSSNPAPATIIQASNLNMTLFSTNSLVTVIRTNGGKGVVSVDFRTVDGTAVAGSDFSGKVVIGGDFINYNGVAPNRTVRLKADGTVDAAFDPESRRLVVPGDRNKLNSAKSASPPGANTTVYSVAVVPDSTAPTQFQRNFKVNPDTFASGLQSSVHDSISVGYAVTAADPNDVFALGQTRHYYAGRSTNSFTPQPGWAFQPDPRTTAAYPRYVENPFTLVASEPLSTFSTDVDTASYANVRRFLNQNQLPPADAVRIEELLNYFSYAYAPPTGDQPFAAHLEVAGCPWAPEHRLLRVGLKGRELKADKRPPSNFVFLIDVSGSMSPAARLPLIKQSLRQLVKRMTENDRVAMVVYASSSGTVLESTSAVNKEVILSAIDRLEAGGSTNGGEGIQRAYDLAVANFIKGGVNRVILCTDGDFNVGITDRGQLLKLIEDRAKSGVFLTTLGVGDDNFKDATLQQLADKGNGNYHYLDTVAEGHKVLVEQMNATLVAIAKDVKVQIEFNPAQAAAYRLIGYEKRILAKEDFNNDAKDAGEIGAGHTVTVLYEVVPAGVPVRGAVDPLKYQGNSDNTARSKAEELAGRLKQKLAELESLEAERAKREARPTEKKIATATAAEWQEVRAALVKHVEELKRAKPVDAARVASNEEQIRLTDNIIGKLGRLRTELLTLKLRYKAPDGDTSKLLEFPLTDARAPFARASADFKFACAVAEFGMLLKDSPFKGTATFDSALELAGEGRGDDAHGYRAEFLNLVAKAKALRK